MKETFTVALLGPQASGKTIFLACLLDTLQSGAGFALCDHAGGFSVAPSSPTLKWLNGVLDDLKKGELPQGTAKTTTLDIWFTSHANPQDKIRFVFHDYRGGRFTESASWTKPDGTDASISSILRGCDGVVLLLSCWVLVHERNDADIANYTRALTEVESLRRHARVPIAILYSQSDRCGDCTDEALLKSSGALGALREKVFGSGVALQHDGFTQLAGEYRVSCLQTLTEDDGRVRPVRKPGGPVFTPDKVREAFSKLAEQMIRVRQQIRRRRRRRVTGVLAVVVGIALVVAALVEKREVRLLRNALSDPTQEQQSAIDAATRFSARWGSWWAVPLRPVAGSDLRWARLQAAERSGGVRGQRLQMILAAIADESATELARNADWYRAGRANAERFIRDYGSSDVRVTVARDTFDEKLRTLEAMTALRAIASVDVPAWVEQLLQTQKFPHFERIFTSLRDSKVAELEWLAAYQGLITSLPGTGPDVLPARMKTAVGTIDKWLTDHADRSDSDPYIRNARQHQRSLQLAIVEREYGNVASLARRDTTASDALARWERFVGSTSNNPIRPANSTEARTWDERLAAGKREVSTLQRRVAQDRHAATVRAKKAHAIRTVAPILDLQGPLTSEKIAKIRSALNDIGDDPVVAAELEQVRDHWEALSFGDVRSAYADYLRARPPAALSSLGAAQRRYLTHSHSFSIRAGRRAFVEASAKLIDWLETPRGVEVIVEQSGGMYVEVSDGKRRWNTVQSGAPRARIEASNLDVSKPITVRYRYSDVGRDTTVATVEIDLLTTPLVLIREYRNGRVRITISSGRPAVPEIPQ